ncbi:MAG: DUF362 domain-containing protein [Desulfocapsaceae bacterium]|jgi:uncharacterized protein (DUF362 family)|nr:DUF362 domain-containing protein [Desulfocapsaceae bacterium]
MNNVQKTQRGIVWNAPSSSLAESIETLLEAVDLYEVLQGEQQLVLKPNLVEALEPPITTPAAFVEAIVTRLATHCPHLQIIIADGTGSLSYDTFHCFDVLGYLPLAKRDNVQLVDLNREPSRHLHNSDCTRWPEMYLPELLFNSFLISLPVLKAHSLSRVTLTMKNMMGCAPPAHFQGSGGWGKSSFHRQIHAAIFDLNRYRTPDFTIMDASVGMARAHLWGPTCNPPVGKIVAAYDPVAIDAYGTSLLGKSWKDIDHISMAHQVLGCAEPLVVEELLGEETYKNEKGEATRTLSLLPE